jgi:hypothetical protein
VTEAATARPSPTSSPTWRSRPRRTLTKRSSRLVVAAGATALALAAAAPASAFFSFQTPSHNIACIGTAKYIRCDTRFTTKYSAPAYKPKGCDLDWGPLSMSPRGRSGVVCAGDTALDPKAPVLAYGKSKLFGGKFRCTSRTSGLRCQNLSKHGWFLSRQKQSIF